MNSREHIAALILQGLAVSDKQSTLEHNVYLAVRAADMLLAELKRTELPRPKRCSCNSAQTRFKKLVSETIW